ncbi:DNA-binding protein [Enemella evansiae]|uniref:DNA-binding protein n=1 Tax=Enemella evansiae TaxID=2016499 RepID=A0A255FX40_9ACTN|nr:excisionase family DNA-binding protein [Enemella evansiae]OYO07882.1 DNA-binding protein [Enemella evansiae]
MPKQAQLVSQQVAAAHAGVSVDTIRRRIADGSLTGYRFGKRMIRVDLNELDALLRPIPTVGGGRIA